MQKRKLKVFFTWLAAACVVIAVFAYVRMQSLDAASTEAALSLCATEIRSYLEGGGTLENLRNYLAFVKMDEGYKQHLLLATENKSDGLSELVAEMRYFSYSRRHMRLLCERIGAMDIGSTAAFSSVEETAGIARAEKLIKKIFGRTVTFREVSGDGIVFVKRYYCGNICIDVCADGALRYLCDVKAQTGADKFFDHFFSGKEQAVVSEEESGGTVYRVVRAEGIYASLCINPKNARIFAAKIVFN